MVIKGVDEVTPVEVIESPPETLRETIESAYDEHTDKPERIRDESGKFVKAEEKPDVRPKIPVAEPIVEPVVEPIKPPSSWKKDYHEKWGGLPREVQDYINQRESEYAKGVSTYKAEYDQLRPLAEAIAPFIPEMQQNGITPDRWISGLGNAHMTLVRGTPEQKLSMFMKLAQDYRVPLDSLFTQQDGKVYFNPQVPQYQPAPQMPDINKLVESKMAEYYTQQQIQHFSTEVTPEGTTAHPHYETVRETMAQLLEAGLADDLNSAYEAALRHPRHSDIYESELKQRQEKEEAEKAEKIKAETLRAKRNVVSIKGSTPQNQAPSNAKGVRGAIEAAFDSIETGRI